MVLHHLHNCCSQHLSPAEGVMVTSRIETAHTLCICVPQKVCCVLSLLSLSKKKTNHTKRAPNSVLRLHISHYKFSSENLTSKTCCENQFCFCLRFSMYWTSARLSKALNHAEMQWGLSICLTALPIHSLCVQNCLCTLFSKLTQTQDNDCIKDAAAEILLASLFMTSLLRLYLPVLSQ